VVKEFGPEAEFRVRSFLLLDKIAHDEGMQATEEEVGNRLNAISKSINKPLAEVRAYYEKNNLINPLQSRIIHEKALEFLLNESKIKIVKSKNGKK
jgi:FKBP-type peptidyl-prolyl cis-trans isomerase (trigger factor)